MVPSSCEKKAEVRYGMDNQTGALTRFRKGEREGNSSAVGYFETKIESWKQR